MKFKIGDKVTMTDHSYNFGVNNGQWNTDCPTGRNLSVIKTDLSAKRSNSSFDDYCDLLVTDGDGGFWFVLSGLCKLVDKKIEVRYFCDDKDVTDKISDETKENLKA